MIERFWLFHCAWARLPRKLVVEQGGWETVQFPFLGGVAEHSEYGPVVLDAPYGQEGPANFGSLLGSVFERFGLNFRERWAVVPRLEECGLSAADVDHVLMTHLHHDHTGGMKTLAHATFHLSAREWEFATEDAGAGPVRGYVGSDYRALSDRVELHESIPHLADSRRGLDVFGDGSVEMFWLPGHTPGHCGYRLRFDDGSAVFFAGDTAFTIPQIHGLQGLGLMPHTVATARGGVDVSIRALRSHLRDHPDDVPVVCHDLELGRRCIEEGPIELGA